MRMHAETTDERAESAAKPVPRGSPQLRVGPGPLLLMEVATAEAYCRKYLTVYGGAVELGVAVSIK